MESDVECRHGGWDLQGLLYREICSSYLTSLRFAQNLLMHKHWRVISGVGMFEKSFGMGYLIHFAG